MSGSVRTRTGFSAPEALVALLLGLFVVHLGFATFARVRSVQVGLAARTDGLTAMRVARHTLGRELGHARPGRDWQSSDDSLSLRAFRGTALVCPLDSVATEVTVSYRGDRLPDATKDSVLLLRPDGTLEIRALRAVTAATTSCGPGFSGSLETWRLDTPVPPGPVVARLFERGSYHLSGSALRYRRGDSGRQPLTPEVWSGATRWDQSGDRLRLDARFRDPASGRPWSAFLSWLDPE
jgi:hypothetical protein